jgi:murein DD-endopeptidase MepM/ murein hydrolase activator NlpD
VLRRAIILCGAAVVLVLSGSGGVSSAVDSGTSSAEAFAIQVSVPGQGGSTAGAVSAPPDAVGVGGAFAFPADGSIAQAASISSSVSASGANSEAEVSVSGLSLFGGELTVGSITVKANAGASSKAASGGTAGSSVSGMAVAGAPVASGPGSSVPLGDWGTATVLQQSSSPYGSRKARGFNAGVTALQVHVNVEHAGVPAGTDVVVGYADVAAEALVPQPVGDSRDDTRRPIKPRVTREEAAKPKKSDRPATPPVRSVPTDVIPRLTASGYVFPVYGSASFSDSFNAPRATTGWHHGEDIFAPLGAPVLAVANGVVYSVGWNEVGGLRFWLQDSAGNEFYYAHLSAFSPLAINGAQVRAGDVIGFVGNTGDAANTPYHLHFEIHPVSLLYRGYDGSAVPPHQYLLAWKRLTDLPFTSVSGWAPPLSDSSRAPRPGAILLQSRDISTGSGLEPGSLERAMRAEGESGADAALAGAVPRAREGVRALARQLSGP